jgi:serine/threonine-protein kinase
MAQLARFDLPGNVDRAIESFRAALSLDANSASAHAGLARGYWFHYYSGDKDRGWLEQGLPVAERAVELDPYLASARVSRGLILSSLGRSEEATGELERALQLDPTRARARVGLGLVHESQGRHEAAAEAYRRAIELAPEDRWPHDLLGSLHYRDGRYGEAAAAFRRSIELAPDGVFGYRNLAAVHYLEGRHAEAAAVIQKALEIQPSASLYSNLGTLLYVQGLYRESAAAYERGLELPGGDADYVIWANLGDARRAAGDGAAARQAYRRAIERIGEEIELHPQEPALRSRRALYRARWGGGEVALSEVASIRKAAGRDEVELTTDVLYRLAVTSELAGDRELALELLGEALEGDYPINRVASDGDLRALREDPRYRRLVEQRAG